MALRLHCLALLVLLLLAGTSHAASTNSTDYSGFFSSMINAITNLPNNIVQSFFTYTVSGLTASSQQLVDASFKFMFSNPDPAWFCTPYNCVMAIVDSLYSI